MEVLSIIDPEELCIKYGGCIQIVFITLMYSAAVSADINRMVELCSIALRNNSLSRNKLKTFFSDNNRHHLVSLLHCYDFCIVRQVSSST